MSGGPDSRRDLPSVDRVLRDARDLVDRWGHEAVRDTVRERLSALRQSDATQPGKLDASDEYTIPAVIAAVSDALDARHGQGLKPVFNLTGVVLHTNLGRACLPASAATAAAEAALNPTNLEFDLGTGRRGNRDEHVQALICEFTGAQAATVVNNNAAAVLLALNTLARGAEVPVSRGELVEIGGSFRMPEVMEAAGCTLVEVGATNRTHLKDYQRAICEQTALLMKVHTSNYRVQGFTGSVDERTLAELAREHGLPSMVDLGSGCLADFPGLGLPAEPRASTYIASGVDLITFSGDKLLGGPQCGIIAGRSELVQRINGNPLKRALRPDSMTLAALHEVLRLYRHPQRLRETLPTLRQLTRPQQDIQAQAQRLLAAMQNSLPPGFTVAVAPCASQIGSGALPLETLPSFALAIAPAGASDARLRQLAAALRELPRPVVGRIHDGLLLLDLRCLDRDEPLFLEQLSQLKDRHGC